MDQPVVTGGLDADVGVRRGTLDLDLTLAVGPGEVVVVLGPNGAGKTTLLRTLAGLTRLDRGSVSLAGTVLADARSGLHRPTHARPVGVVFSDLLLFPHLTVLDNVAFGPRCRGNRPAAARAVARGWLRRLAAEDLADARPAALSGGQAQRVALARALATDPALLLLDEPLAALDARTRLLVRGELGRHLSAYGGAALVVTHDPTDAVVLADRLVVVEAGRVVQTGPPAEVARRPRTDYVARLVGLNLVAGVASGGDVRLPGGGTVTAAAAWQGPVLAAFRPAAVALFSAEPHGTPRNVWRVRVVGVEPHGDGVRVEVGQAWPSGPTLVAEVTPAAVADLGLAPGAEVWATVKASEVEVYPRSG